MALAPNQWKDRVLDSYADAEALTESTGTTSVQEGWYLDQTLPEPQLIERRYITRNAYDIIMYRSIERWEYTKPGSAPHKHYKSIEAKVFLPVINVGRALKLVQEEFTVFWTFTPWAKDVLAYRKHVDAYVVYDKKPVADMDAAAIAAAEAKGYNTTNIPIVQKSHVIDNARMWDEAVKARTIVEKADVNQNTYWMKNAITVETDVQEEPDRWTLHYHHKNQVRPDDNKTEGPVYVKREGWVYDLEVPVQPPTITAKDSGVEGITLEVTGGGADIPIPLNPEQIFRRGPEEYKIFRKKIEGDQPQSDDPLRIWLPGQAPERPPTREIVENTFVGGFDGVGDSGEEDRPPGLPTKTSYTEPHDPDPVLPDSWQHMTDAKNEADDIDKEDGHATAIDPNVKDLGDYSYVAVAVVADSESPLSNIASLTKSVDGEGGLSTSIKIRENGDIEADIEIPSDDLPPELDGYGETLELEVPAQVISGPVWPYPTDGTLATTAEVTTDTELIEITHSPRDEPDKWTIGRMVMLTDISNPGHVMYNSHKKEHWFCAGNITAKTDTTTTVLLTQGADGHTYPVGSEIKLIHSQLYDPRQPPIADEGAIEALILDIGKRQGLKNQNFKLNVKLTIPLIALRHGQTTYFENINWEAYGNNLWMSSVVENRPWRLRGWTIEAIVDQNGIINHVGTDLVLEET